MFADGFESGSFSAWSLNVNDGGDLSVSAQAALFGSYGMKAVLDDNNSIYVTDWKPYEETRYRARFYFDPNAISMSNNDAHYLFYALNRDGVVIVRVEFRYYSSAYQVRAETVNDGSTWSSSSWAAISDAPHYLEFQWQAATAAGANNGSFTFWLDGAQQATFTTIDNDTRRLDYAQLGAVAGVDNGSRGTYYIDAFESRRDTYIGQMAALLPPPVAALLRTNFSAMGSALSNFFAWLAGLWQTWHKDAAPAVNQSFGDPMPANTLFATGVTGGRTLRIPIGIMAPMFTAALSPEAAPHSEPAFSRLETATTTTITYTYDPLYRLTRADYNDGTYFHYTYDAAGNRLAEETTGGAVNAYTYDTANRLASVDGIAYTWDDNGNLLNDGTKTYTYDHANHLTTVNESVTQWGQKG